MNEDYVKEIHELICINIHYDLEMMHGSICKKCYHLKA